MGTHESLGPGVCDLAPIRPCGRRCAASFGGHPSSKCVCHKSDGNGTNQRPSGAATRRLGRPTALFVCLQASDV